MSFLIKNYILHPNHHGNRVDHSTTTALVKIYSTIYLNHDSNYNSVLFANNLSTAFDTIYHLILLAKLEHYSIRGKTLELFKSFLENRFSYVHLETFNSNKLILGQYGCVQGSKISGLLYILYTNEIPLIVNIIKQPDILIYITGQNPPNFTNITHKTINYVDNSAHIISFTNTNELKTYLENFYTLIYYIYISNKLKINSDKTKIIFSH